jgi:hypothetical protein
MKSPRFGCDLQQLVKSLETRFNCKSRLVMTVDLHYGHFETAYRFDLFYMSTADRSLMIYRLCLHQFFHVNGIECHE